MREADRKSDSASPKSHLAASIAAVAIVGFVFLLLVGGGVFGFIVWQDRAQKAELAALARAMRDLDRSFAQTLQPMEVAAVDLVNDYASDEVTAEMEYGGKPLLIEGMVAAFDKDDSVIDIDAGTAADGGPLLVRCELPLTAAEQEKIVSRLMEQTPDYPAKAIRLRGRAGVFVDGVLEIEQGELVD